MAMSSAPATTETVQPGSAKFTYGHLFVLIGATLGVIAFVWMFITMKKKKPGNGGFYS